MYIKISIITLIILIIFIIYSLIIRMRIVKLQEDVNEAKSCMLNAKNKYNDVLETLKTTHSQLLDKTALNNINQQISVQTYQSTNLVVSSSLISNLANNLEEAEKVLNEKINKYNKYVKQVHVRIVAIVFGYKIIKYVD